MTRKIAERVNPTNKPIHIPTGPKFKIIPRK